MQMPQTNKQEGPFQDTPKTDGRRNRAVLNRKKVIRAMLECVRDGNLAPNAEDVAERAGVGLRSVFRYFKDMDSLIHEMIIQVDMELYSIALQDVTEASLESRLFQIIDIRTEFYERAMPFKIAASVHRYRSEKLQERYNQGLANLREWLVAVLPQNISKDNATFEAIDAVLSFDTWRRIRHEQKQGVEQGRLILRKLLKGIMSQA